MDAYFARHPGGSKAKSEDLSGRPENGFALITPNSLGGLAACAQSLAKPGKTVVMLARSGRDVVGT
jgi:hypothetical protein